MDREIKFRVWNKQTKEMFTHFEGARIDLALHYYETSIKVSKPMQYIGLKDKNGKELYQKDIIKYVSRNDGESEFFSEIDSSMIYGLHILDNSLRIEFDMYRDGLTDGNFEIVGNSFEETKIKPSSE